MSLFCLLEGKKKDNYVGEGSFGKVISHRGRGKRGDQQRSLAIFAKTERAIKSACNDVRH